MTVERIKVVINACYGGFGLSEAGYMRLAELKGVTLTKDGNGMFAQFFTGPPPKAPARGSESNKTWAAYNESYKKVAFNVDQFPRTDPHLVQVVEELGDKASGSCAELVIREVPKGTLYRITEYDGYESIEEHGSGDWNIA